MKGVQPRSTAHLNVKKWDLEADRLVDSIVQHIFHVYGDDPRCPHLLHRQVLKASERCKEERHRHQRESNAFSSSSSSSDDEAYQDFQHKQDEAAGYPAHPYASSQSASSASQVFTRRTYDSKRKMTFEEDSQRRVRARITHAGPIYPSASTTSQVQQRQSSSRSTSGRSSSRTVSASSGLTRASASTSLQSLSNISDLSSIYPPGNQGAKPRLEPPYHNNRDEPGDTDELAAADDTVFFTPQQTLRRVPSPAPPTILSPISENGSRFLEDFREPSYYCMPAVPIANNALQSSPSDPELYVFTPSGQHSHLPVPSPVTEAITRLYSAWSKVTDDPNRITRVKEWRYPSPRYTNFCVSCSVRRADKRHGYCFNGSCRLTDDHQRAEPQLPARTGQLFSTIPPAPATEPTACEYCINQRIPCLKAETVTWVPKPGVVGSKLRLWLLPLPADRRKDCDPGDVGFWMVQGEKSKRKTLFAPAAKHEAQA